MLGVSRSILLVHQVICVSLSIGLSGLAVGLGAMIPNFREPSPAKIAAGFGGTLNLVLSTVLIVLLIAAFRAAHAPSAWFLDPGETP